MGPRDTRDIASTVAQPAPVLGTGVVLPPGESGRHRGQGTRPKSFNRSGLSGTQLPVASGLLAPFPEMRVSAPPTQLTFTPHLPSQTWPCLLGQEESPGPAASPGGKQTHRRRGPAFAGFRLSSVSYPRLCLPGCDKHTSSCG